MNHTEKLTRYTANFVDELVCSGLEDVVISPGSRSTPLAMMFHAHEKIRHKVLIDERSAAYFALGIAKETKKAVVILCTSGTAAANYFPAIVEAHYARVPLIVLTADRPHELRDIGASQTINQLNMYGSFVKEFHEMASPDCTSAMIKYVRNRAARAVRVAEQGNPGPIHLNFPFREPLVPDFTLENIWGTGENSCYNDSYEGKKQLNKEQLNALYDKIARKKKGLIVCGPQIDEKLGDEITALSKVLKVPVLADPLSQLRAGDHDKTPIIPTYDALFRDENWREQLKPDYIIRFGAMPISKSYLFFVQEHEDVLQIVVEDYENIREPTNHPSEYVYQDSRSFCKSFRELIPTETKDTSWLRKWQQINNVISSELQQKSNDSLTEGEAVRELIQALPDKSRIFIANSMPVRDLDTFLLREHKQIKVHANRGVSGIDGTVSSALGVAATIEHPVTLITGDLSFYHDLNSLLAVKQYDISITVLLINNNGGGIFSFLPQANEEEHFEPLFGTPTNINFEKAVEMYGGTYQLVSTKKELHEALDISYKEGGLHVLEVQTDRNENVLWHKALWNRIKKRLDRYEL